MIWVGCWVALAVWCVLAPAGHRAVDLASPEVSVPGATATGSRARRVRFGRRADGRATDIPVRVAIAQVVAVLRTGTPPGDAWPRALDVPTTRDGIPHEPKVAARLDDASAAAAVVAATRLSRDVGAPLGQVLEVVGDALVARDEAEAERDASLAGPRSTARVLAWLPALGVLLGWALGADPVATATDGGAGTLAVGAGLVSLAIGRWWTGRLVAAARRAGDAL